MSRLVLGNLTPEQFANTVDTVFTSDELATLHQHHSPCANPIARDGFHIFTDPVVQVWVGLDAVDVVVPIFTAANQRAPFNRPVSFYPA